MITLSRAEENEDFRGLQKRTDECANSVDEEYCRRTNNFLLINRLKTNVPVQSSRDTVWNSVDFFVSCLAHAENKPWYINLNVMIWEGF